MSVILSFDIGSTGCKTCLYDIEDQMTLIGASQESYTFTHTSGDFAEQDPALWFQAMTSSSRELAALYPEQWTQVAGIAVCAQMQGVVLVDRKLNPLRPAMSYMDQRGGEQKRKRVGQSPSVDGFNLFKLLYGLQINGAAAVSVKDPVWKYLWVQQHEPEIFEKVYKWLDVKEYAIAALTGSCVMTRDSAFTTFLTDERKQKSRWSKNLVKMYGVYPDHLPEIIDSTQVAGTLTDDAALNLGLLPGVPVFGGGGDASMITVGTGATKPGSTYVYTGTSGWVSSTVRKRKVDVGLHIASIVGAQKGLYNYFAEQETAGKCLEWVKDHLALDDIAVYLESKSVVDSSESRFSSLYEFLVDTITEVEPGCGGVVFTPWLHGNRCPFEDPEAGGIFFNLKLTTGKRKMIRAVVEGICLHQRWLLDSVKKSFPVNGEIRFSGGGALSLEIAQILADVLNHPVVPVCDPQNAGAAGAALTAAAGLGVLDDLAAAADYVPVQKTLYPQQENRNMYDRHYEVLKRLYKANRGLFSELAKGE